METSARHFIVGLGVLALMVLGVMCSLWYFGEDKDSTLKHFVIYFKKQSVSGLQISSQITMRGIRIGEVEEISILSEESEGARIQIKVQENAPLTKQTRAVIERNLLTGLSWIELGAISISEADQSLPSPNPNEKLPFILEGEGVVEKMKVSLSEAVENLNLTLNSIQTFLNEENRMSLQHGIKSLETLSASLATDAKSARSTLDKTNELLDTSKNLMITINDASKLIASETVEISHSFRSTADRIVSTVEEYRDPRKIIRGPAKGDLGPGEKP